jgi:RHS repeat-associated protein
VVKIVAASGDSYGVYCYDAWGNITRATSNNDVINYNPLRYRGYVYDTETGFYYLQSRYYDPAIGRFINADSFASTGQGFIGYNMFAYCLNNPVLFNDQNGKTPYAPEAKHISLDDLQASGYGAGGAGLIYGAGLLVGFAAKALLSVKVIAKAIASHIEQNEGKYYVYVLSDASNTVQYVGRTKDPEAREAAHRRNPDRANLNFEIVAECVSYERARGLEQTLMLYYHTLNSSNKMNNQINGISPNNGNKDSYLSAAKEALGNYLWNQFSNDVLNWYGQ